MVACLIIVSTPSPGFVKLKAKFGQVSQVDDKVDQVKNQVGQVQGQGLDNID